MFDGKSELAAHESFATCKLTQCTCTLFYVHLTFSLYLIFLHISFYSYLYFILYL